MHLWLDTGGSKAVFHYLLNRDTGDFNPAAPAFKTAAKIKIMELKLSQADTDSQAEVAAKLLKKREELARYGITAQQAREGYQAAVPIIERGRQLSDFYQESPYTQRTAEEEIFGLSGAAEAGTKRKRLSSLEQASFSGQSGLTSGALSRDRAGQY